MNTCSCCYEEFEKELAKIRIDYPDGEDWESCEICEECLAKINISFPTT